MDFPPEHDDSELFRAIGAALHNWSLVEMQLSGLFSTLSDIGDQKKSHALFDAIISFETRLAMCDRLMAFESADEVEAETWSRMSARLSKFYKKRHELAHFTMVAWAKEPAISPFLTFEGMFSDQPRLLNLAQVRERSAKFIELHMAIGWFNATAFMRRGKHEPFPPPDPAEPPLVPRLRALAIQILEERKQSAKSPPATA